MFVESTSFKYFGFHLKTISN